MLSGVMVSDRIQLKPGSDPAPTAQQLLDTRTGLGLGNPIEVADAAARKLAGSYTGITLTPWWSRVLQADDDSLWLYRGGIVTSDNSWRET
jgi:hypothetical protein